VIKVATAEKNVIGHFGGLNEDRRKLALRERLFSEVLDSIYHNTGILGTGVILLLAGNAMRTGSFTIGDFSLFVYLLQGMSDITAWTGSIAARYKQLNVSVERMYRRFYFRWKPIFRMVREMSTDRHMLVRRLREGREFLGYLNERKRGGCHCKAAQ